MQREVLAALRAERFPGWWSVTDLAAEIGETPNPSRSAVESVRRAVKALAAVNAVDLEAQDESVGVGSSRVDRGDGYAYRPVHLSSRGVLCVHLPLSVEEKARRAQHLAESLDRLVALDAEIRT